MIGKLPILLPRMKIIYVYDRKRKTIVPGSSYTCAIYTQNKRTQNHTQHNNSCHIDELYAEWQSRSIQLFGVTNLKHNTNSLYKGKNSITQICSIDLRLISNCSFVITLRYHFMRQGYGLCVALFTLVVFVERSTIDAVAIDCFLNV